MKPTKAPVLVAVFLLFGVVADVILRATYDSLPTLPIGPVATVLVFAVIEVLAAWTTRNRLRGKNLAKPIDPLGVARFAALAKASSLLGVAAAGFWAGTFAYLVRLQGGGDTIDHDKRVAIAGIVTGCLLVGSALWLEWVCRIRRPPGEHRDPERGSR